MAISSWSQVCSGFGKITWAMGRPFYAHCNDCMRKYVGKEATAVHNLLIKGKAVHRSKPLQLNQMLRCLAPAALWWGIGLDLVSTYV